MAPSRYLPRFSALILAALIALGFAPLLSCSGPGHLTEIVLKPGESGATKDDPVEISATPSSSTDVQFVLSAANGFTGDVSVLVFPDPLVLKDINDDDRSVSVNFTPPRPYTFSDVVASQLVTVTFDAEDNMVPPADAVYRIKISSGAVGELVDSGVDLYFKIVP